MGGDHDHRVTDNDGGPVHPSASARSNASHSSWANPSIAISSVLGIGLASRIASCGPSTVRCSVSEGCAAMDTAERYARLPAGTPALPGRPRWAQRRSRLVDLSAINLATRRPARVPIGVLSAPRMPAAPPGSPSFETRPRARRRPNPARTRLQVSLRDTCARSCARSGSPPRETLLSCWEAP